MININSSDTIVFFFCLFSDSSRRGLDVELGLSHTKRRGLDREVGRKSIFYRLKIKGCFSNKILTANGVYKW